MRIISDWNACQAHPIFLENYDIQLILSFLLWLIGASVLDGKTCLKIMVDVSEYLIWLRLVVVASEPRSGRFRVKNCEHQSYELGTIYGLHVAIFRHICVEKCQCRLVCIPWFLCACWVVGNHLWVDTNVICNSSYSFANTFPGTDCVGYPQLPSSREKKLSWIL